MPLEDAPPETDTTPGKTDTDPDAWGGAPLRSTLKLLAVPGVLFALIIVLGIPLPTWALYGIGGLFAIVLLPRMWRGPGLLPALAVVLPPRRGGERELLLALVMVYLPLNKMFVVPIAPGVNATNILFALLIVSA